ncbi:MAG: sulfite reductase [Clostridia bacterium]|jgi:NAD(P)H-nitrite reductase large subunit|nr:sulfite reductase [Clostridia bacterium]
MVLKNEKNIKLRFLPKEPGIFTKEQIKTIYEVVSNQGTELMELVLDLPLSITVPSNLEKEAKQQLIAVGLLVVPNGDCIKEVKVCPKCDHGVGTYRELGRLLIEGLIGKETSAPVRVSVSGCGCQCAMSMLQDIGLVAGLDGYAMYIGGTPYGKPAIGEKVGNNISDDKIIPAINAILSVYESRKEKRKYLYQVVKAIGTESFSEAIKEIL